MNKLLMTCGVAGSGKTTYAQKWCEENVAVLLDSDNMRKVLFGDSTYQGNNELVFRTMMDRTKSALRIGKNVAYCATNLSSKRRIKFVQEIRKEFPNVQMECVVCVGPPSLITIMNTMRDRKVDSAVIWRHLRQFQVPYYGEGWDEIYVHRLPGYSADTYYSDLLQELANFGDQHNPHHSLTLFAHSFRAANYVLSMYPAYTNVAQALVLHDVGKMYTQTFDEDGIAHYYGHENVSSQIALAAGLSLREAALICYHMVFTDNVAAEVWHKRFNDEDFWAELKLLHEADIGAR